jgi:RimJ/RimL family protein N-acetyltransferase
MKALSKLLNEAGQVTRWPTKPQEKTLVIEYLASKFSKDGDYSEKDVNELLKTWHTFSDWALLRRELFERGFLAREKNGSTYWRTALVTELIEPNSQIKPRRSTVQLFRLENYGVRLLTPEDKKILQDLFKRCEDFHILSNGEPLQGHEAEETLIDRPPKQPLHDMYKIGLFSGENLIGFFDVAKDYPQQDNWYFGLYLVDAALRGQGIGKRVLAGLEPWLKEQGAKQVMLSVLEENQAALRFWQREGFTQTRVLPAKTFGKKIHVRFELAKQLS